MNRIFSIRRLGAIIWKEFIQMRRDRLTFGMMIGIPTLQLVLFGFAINTDPKQLPTALLIADHSPFARSLVSAMQQSDYFRFIQTVRTEEEGRRLIERGSVQFLVHIPSGFGRALVRGQRPALLVVADATDPAATSNALDAMEQLAVTALQRDLTGPLAPLRAGPAPVELIVHRNYNPEGITQYNIVPGLLGVVLTMTMVVITALAITRERERGTMENLLSTPVRPVEVILGKLTPYIVVGYIQVALILAAARFLFHIPMRGEPALLLAAVFLFIIANLAVGITFSTVAQNQLQAMQMSFFFFLPSILLSGFMFPFRGMPTWAQWIGEVLPLTHFLRIARGILLKGNGLEAIGTELLPIAAFFLVVIGVGLKRYRQTLD